MSLRPIKDIRFFEGETRACPGNASHSYLGTLHPAADGFRLAPTGTRYALALAAAGFQTRGYHHVYVVLAPELPLGAVEVQDRKSQQTGKVELTRVHDFEDVFALINTVAISEGTIVLSPRSSAAAQYTTRKYKTPFRVPVDRVLQGTPGC